MRSSRSVPRRRRPPAVSRAHGHIALSFALSLLLFCGVLGVTGCTGPPYKCVVDATATVFFVEEAGRLHQVAEAKIAYWVPDPPTFRGRIEAEDLATHEVVSTDVGEVRNGENGGYRVKIPDTATPTRVAFRLYDVTGGAPGELQNELVKDWVPQRKWTVWLIPSSHIDLYSTANADITPEQHRKIIDTACDLCERYPDYTFQLETRLPIYEYLDGHRSAAQVDRFIRLIRDGRIDYGAQLSGAHQFESSGESYIQGQMVPWNLGVDLEKKYGIRPEFCAMFDVPGVMKQLPEFLGKAGVRYLVHGPNTSYRIQEMMGVPYLFNWKAESGAGVLTWRTSFGYNQEKENYYRLTDPDPRVREDSLNAKLTQRQECRDDNGNVNPDLAYPYDETAIPWDYGDNEPATDAPVKFVEDWSARWAYPRVKIGSYAEFLSNMQSRFGERIPERRGELGNAWEFVAMNQGIMNLYDRASQRSLTDAQKWWSVARLLGAAGYPEGAMQAAWDNMAKVEAHDLFYGAKLDPETGELIPDFMNPDWAKAEWSLIAERNARTAYDQGLSTLASLIDCGGATKVPVFNQLAFARSAPVAVELPSELADGRFALRDDATGNTIPHQVIDAETYQDVFGRRPSMQNQDEHFAGAYPDPAPPNGDYVVFVAPDVPGLGYRTFSVERCAEPPVYAGGPAVGDGVLENRYYRVSLDPASGAVTSVFDKELGKELVDGAAEFAGNRLYFNQFLIGTTSLDSISILINMPPFTNNRPLWQPFLDSITRNSVKTWEGEFSGAVKTAASGPVLGALIVTGNDRWGFPRRQTVAVFEGVKRVDFVNWVEKTGFGPFARFALSYPLAMDGGFETRYNNAYSMVDVGADELPGGPRPHRHLGDWIEFAGEDRRVAIASADAGPFTLGRLDLNLVDDARYTVPEKPYYFPVYLDTCTWSAFVVPGSYSVKFSLSSTGAATGEAGWGHRSGSSYVYPLAGLFAKNAGGPLRGPSASLFAVDSADVDIPVVKKPKSGRGLVLRLVETEGRATRVTLSLAGFMRCRGAWAAGLDEVPAATLDHTSSRVFVDLKPHEIATVRLDLSIVKQGAARESLHKAGASK